MANHSSILPWKIPWTKEPGGLQSGGLQRVRHVWATKRTHTHTDPITALHSHLQLTILRSSDWVVSNAYILKAQTFDGDSVVPIWFVHVQLDFSSPCRWYWTTLLPRNPHRHHLKLSLWTLILLQRDSTTFLIRAVTHRFDSLHAHVLSCFCHVRLFETPWTIAHKAPLSMGFSRQDTGMGCHFLLQGIFLTQGSNPPLL